MENETTYEVINAVFGQNVHYNADDAEFSGTYLECDEYINGKLREHRKVPGQQNDGTFLSIRDAETKAWI